MAKFSRYKFCSLCVSRAARSFLPSRARCEQTFDIPSKVYGQASNESRIAEKKKSENNKKHKNYGGRQDSPATRFPTFLPQLRVGKQKNYIILLLFGWRITLCQTLRSLWDSHYPNESFPFFPPPPHGRGESRKWKTSVWGSPITFGSICRRISAKSEPDSEQIRKTISIFACNWQVHFKFLQMSSSAQCG